MLCAEESRTETRLTAGEREERRRKREKGRALQSGGNRERLTDWAEEGDARRGSREWKERVD